MENLNEYIIIIITVCDVMFLFHVFTRQALLLLVGGDTARRRRGMEAAHETYS